MGYGGFPLSAYRGIRREADYEIDQAAKNISDREAAEQAARYQNINVMEKTDKINALKDPKINPLLVPDAYDGLASAYHKWTIIGAKAASMKPEEQQRVASGFYEKMLVPLYKQLGRDPISKDVWMKSAFDSHAAMGYDIDGAYATFMPWGTGKGALQGFASLDKSFSNATATISNLLGMTLKDQAIFYKALITGDIGKWHQHAIDIQNNQTGFFEEARRETSDIPILGAISRQEEKLAREDTFWHDAIPNQNFAQKATAVIAEYGPQLGLFKYLTALNEGAVGMVGGAASKIAPVRNLTAALSVSPLGKGISAALLSGTENLLYGTMIRDQTDKEGAIKDGLTGLALGGIFHVAGRGTGKLSELYSDNPLANKVTETLDRIGAKKREATASEYEQEFKKDMANNISVAGVAGQQAIDEHALALGAKLETSGLKGADLRSAKKQFLDEDKVAHAPVLSALTKVQKLAGKKSISELMKDPVERRTFLERLKAMRVDAAKTLNENSQGLQQTTAAKATAGAKAPGAKITLEFVKKSMLRDPQLAAAVNMGSVKPEDFQKMVEVEYGKRVAAAGAMAEKKTNQAEGTIREATIPAKKRVSLQKSLPSPPSTRIRERYSVNRKGEPSYGLSISKDWKVYLRSNKLEGKSEKEVRTFLEDLPDEEFSDLLHQFLPPQLKEAGLHFESQWEATRGPNNPNLYGFMYNYRQFLPKPIADMIPDKLMETLKVGLNMPKSRVMTDRQLQHFATSMYNHIDNFVGSERFQTTGERNIFRSTLPDMMKDTKWQANQMMERFIHEEELIEGMFKGNDAAKLTAMNTLQAIHRQMKDVQLGGSLSAGAPEEYKKLAKQLGDFLIQQNKRPEANFKLENFNFDPEEGGGYK